MSTAYLSYKLGDLLESIYSGGTPSTTHPEYWDGELPWLSSGETNQRYIARSEKKITPNGVKNSSTRFAPKGAIVMASAGQGKTRGQTSFLKVGMYINQSIIAIIPDRTKLISEYLYYNLHTRYDELRSASDSSSTRGSITTEMLKGLKICVPDLPTQTKIADILSTYDDAIENNNRRIKILEQLAENLYKEWFVRMRFPGHETAEYENGLPKGWNVCKIGAIVDRLPFNRLYKKDELNSEGKIIVVDQSTDEYIGFHNNEPSHKASMDSPILLFGDHSCKYQLMIQDFSLGENVVPFQTKGCDPYFLFFAINGIVTTTEYKRHWGELTSRKILLPESHLQETFSQKLKPLKAQQEQLILVNRKLRKQRDRLLPRLMSGKCLVTLNANKAITV